MSSDPRLILTEPVYALLKELAALRKARGKSSRQSVIGNEILADWLPAYIENEKAIALGGRASAIARGEGSGVGAMINWGVSPQCVTHNILPQPHQTTPPAVPASSASSAPSSRGNRDKLQAFLSSR